MKLLNRLFTLVVFMVLLALGVVLIGTALSPEWWNAVRAFASQASRLSGVCAGLGMVCLAVVLALTGVRKGAKERILSFRNEEGTVSISTIAIADYVGKLSSEFPSIVRMQPRVVPRRSMVDLIVDLRVKAGPQIHEVCEVLQRRVRETMVNGLGISEVRRVVVNVKEISPEHKGE